MTEHLEKYYMGMQHSMTTEKMHQRCNSSRSEFEGRKEGNSFSMMSSLWHVLSSWHHKKPTYLLENITSSEKEKKIIIRVPHT